MTEPPKWWACFNTQPPEGGWVSYLYRNDREYLVSTHSRLKAAGRQRINKNFRKKSFNTQPPEGGWRA